MSDDKAKSQAELPADMIPRLWRLALFMTASAEDARALVSRTLDDVDEASTDGKTSQKNTAPALFARMARLRKELAGRTIATAAKTSETETGTENSKDPVFDGAVSVPDNQFTERMLRQVERLPESVRTSVLLVYGEGLSYGEAAGVLEAPEDVIVDRLIAARKVLAFMQGASEDAAP
ncbi:MAG: hypothetical protein AAGF59_09530 [Pseudomonadota bacterium]